MTANKKKDFFSTFRKITVGGFVTKKSGLSIVSANFFRKTYKQTSNGFFLNKYDLIHKNQSGFRPKHSCQTAFIKLIDQWMSCIDKGDIVGTLFLDFRKAFDLIDHSILIKKLLIYKF